VLPAADDPIELPTMQTVEDRYIQRVLQGAGGNKTLAAKILGFDRRTLYRKLAALSASGGGSTPEQAPPEPEQVPPAQAAGA
jgi:DNA-binding NtrC family response regulator